MKIIKITSMGCPSCIIMNNVLDEISNLEVVGYDYDFDDEAKRYNPGKILPVIIFFDEDKEIIRLVGEHSKEEILKIIGR